MVTLELLQFIRQERELGMGNDELARLLIAEGGWNEADLNEAYRALEAPLLLSGAADGVPLETHPVFRVTQKSQPEPPRDLAPPHNGSAPNRQPPLRDVAPNLSTTMNRSVRETGSEAEMNIHGVTDGPSPRPTIASVNSSGDNLSKLLFRGGKSPTDKLSPKTEGLRPPLGTKTPAALPESPIDLFGVKKTTAWSLEGLLKEKSNILSTPPVNVSRDRKDEVVSPPVAPAVELPQAVTPFPVKLNFSALRSKILPNQKQSIPATPPHHPPHQLSPLQFKKGLAKSLAEQSAHGGEAESPHEISSVSKVEGKKKTAIREKRTMASDLLLHGVDVAALPPFSQMTNEKKETPRASLAPSTFPVKAQGRNKTKYILGAILGIVFLLALIGGGYFAYVRSRVPDPSVLFRSASAQLLNATSFAYKGELTTDFVLSAPAGGAPRDGAMKFSLGYDGSLLSGSGGYGDGNHHVAFRGGWHFGSSIFSADVTSDVRRIGNALYVHVLSLPGKDNLNTKLLEDNWVKVDFSDIASKLQLFGVIPGTERYGSFGATSGAEAFQTILKQSFPITVSGGGVAETQGGVATTRIHVVALPTPTVDLIHGLYQKYFDKDLTLSEEQMLRLKAALAKISGDVWVDTKTGAWRKIALSANFDDDMISVHVKGPATLIVSFADENKPVSVTPLVGALTLPEVRIKMNENQTIIAMRARDQVKIDTMKVLAGALESYRREKGRYPKELTELYGAGMSATPYVATSSVDLVALKDYVYRSYQKADTFSKSVQCKATGKVCAFYHLGVSLEDGANDILSGDSDRTDAILGADTAGCAGEAKRACYDIVSPIPIVTTSLPNPPPAPKAAASSTSAAASALIR